MKCSVRTIWSKDTEVCRSKEGEKEKKRGNSFNKSNNHPLIYLIDFRLTNTIIKMQTSNDFRLINNF